MIWFRPIEGTIGFITPKAWVNLKAPWLKEYIPKYGWKAQEPRATIFGFRIYYRFGQQRIGR